MLKVIIFFSRFFAFPCMNHVYDCLGIINVVVAAYYYMISCYPFAELGVLQLHFSHVISADFLQVTIWVVS